MNNELRDKIVESFKNPLRWEIVKREEDYQYEYVDSITVMDFHFLGTLTDDARNEVNEKLQKWKDHIKKINHLKGQEKVS